MNERDSARQEARAQEDRETAAALTEIGITPSEASLFNVVHYGLTVPPSDLCRRAGGRDYTLGGRVTVKANQAALADCLSKGWLQIVDEDLLVRLRDEMRREGLLGPVYDYPSLGGVDFTRAGAEQWFRVCQRLWNGGHDESFAFCDVVRDKSAHYFPSRSRAMAELERSEQDESVVSITGPDPIGPWRADWWRQFPEGFRIDVEQRRQWEGRSSVSGGHIFFFVGNLPLDLAHAKDVLDRHNVAWVEWVVLTCLEQSCNQPRIVRVATETSKRLGKSLTDAECQDGLEACMRNGWLRPVDEQVIAEIRSLLSADSSVMPVPYDPEKFWTEIDFSAAGAQLYRMVSAEIFGSDWEDGICVEDTYFREEHRYCATEAGLAAVINLCAEVGETPTSIRTVPIGPWCVYWWRRFRSGYRLELTFGEP